MRNLIKTFVLRGLVGMGFGPIVLGIIYLCLYNAGVVDAIPVPELIKAILSITIMAFIAAGIPVIYQLEQLPLISAILLHGAVLYLDYLVMYLFNDWIVKEFSAIGVFTAIFAGGFALVWLMIYLINRKHAKKLSIQLHKTK